MGTPQLHNITLLSLLVVGCPTTDEPLATSATDPSTGGGSTSSASLGSGGDDTGTSSSSSTTDTASTTELSTTTTGSDGFCGDGIIHSDEECDDGDANNAEGPCSDSCALTCGDGLVQESEECDEGPQNNNAGQCTKICEAARCGDNYTQPGEQCDEGDENSAEPGGCHPVSCTKVLLSCGNGVQDEGEECDSSAEGMETVSCSDTCYFISRTMFVSSETYAPDFVELDEADKACVGLATGAGLAGADRFVAFLSTPGAPIASRVDAFSGKYTDSNGKLIAMGNSGLFSGSLMLSMGRDEHGLDATRENTFAWTGSSPSGESLEPSCDAWQSSMLLVSGTVGSLMAFDGEWANTGTYTCKTEAHIYCIQSSDEVVP